MSSAPTDEGAGGSRRSTRDKILDAAAALFAERGAGVTLEEIAHEAGVSRQSVYVHFGSRTGLLVAVAQHVDADGTLDRLVERVLAAETALGALKAVVELHAEYSPVAYPVARVFMAHRHEDEALRLAWEDRMEGRRNLYRFVVDELVKAGLLTPELEPETAVDLTWALTSWQVWEQLVVEQGWSKRAYHDHLKRVLTRSLVAGGVSTGE